MLGEDTFLDPMAFDGDHNLNFEREGQSFQGDASVESGIKCVIYDAHPSPA